MDVSQGKYRLRTIILFLLLNALGHIVVHANSALSARSSDARHRIRIITINVWSGLDYHGALHFGEYETPERRELRFQLLLRQLKEFDPDVIFVQEANPVAQFSSRLADSLSFDEIHQVCNAGVKFAGFGIPSNFKEGIATLARKNLKMEKHSVWKLSGGLGIYGDDATLNFDEAEFAQVARIAVNGRSALLVNVHLSAYPPRDSVTVKEVARWLLADSISPEEASTADEILSYGSERRQSEVRALLENISRLPTDVPLVLGGDFNSEIESKEISMLSEQGGLGMASGDSVTANLYTWDPVGNENVSYSTRLVDASGHILDLAGRLAAVYDSKQRTIDYIFFNQKFSRSDVRGTEVVLDSSFDGIHASDHFGVMADIDFSKALEVEGDSDVSETRSHIEPLPILSYDTDIGFGYGAKLFLFDLLNWKESFDFVLFNSTKGERWYRGVFSFPDFEWREGKEYPFAVDLTFDYDKWLRDNFYGIGNTSLFADGEKYTRVPVEFSAAFSRGFTPELVGQFVAKYKSVENYAFDPRGRLKDLPPSLNTATARFSSVGVNVRYDTRDSYVNPSAGFMLQGETEYALRGALGNVSFLRLAGWFQFYRELFYPPTIFALRVGVQQITGDSLPVQVLTSLGGNNTLRGFTQDRFLDRAAALMNAELRFHIVWRLGGVAGIDAGKVWSSITRADLGRWAANPVAGLRLYMDNFVVRADLGFGPEGTGFYFNFGHIF